MPEKKPYKPKEQIKEENETGQNVRRYQHGLPLIRRTVSEKAEKKRKSTIEHKKNVRKITEKILQEYNEKHGTNHSASDADKIEENRKKYLKNKNS